MVPVGNGKPKLKFVNDENSFRCNEYGYVSLDTYETIITNQSVLSEKGFNPDDYLMGKESEFVGYDWEKFKEAGKKMGIEEHFNKVKDTVFGFTVLLPIGNKTTFHRMASLMVIGDVQYWNWWQRNVHHKFNKIFCKVWNFFQSI